MMPQSVWGQMGEKISNHDTKIPNRLSSTNVSIDSDASVCVWGEIEDKRTETTKTYRMSDGSYVVAEYGKIIHYLDENGDFQDYDNTLSVSEVMTRDPDDFAGVVNAESDTYIKLANNSNSNNLVKIQKDNYKISMHLVDADKSKAIEIHTPEAEPAGNDIDSATTLHKFSSGAVYRDILPSVDLEYIIYGSTVKENIIVKDRLDSYTFTFELKLENLTPTLMPDGSIVLSDEQGKAVSVIPKGVMFDANGESSNAVEYTLTHKNGNKYLLTVTADENWINAEDRVFPITVDPTFTPADNGANTEDIGINSSKTVSAYNASTIKVGYTGNVQNKMLIRAKTLPELPDSAVIVDAKLKLAKSSVSLGTTVAAYTVTGEWSSTTLTSTNIPNCSSIALDYRTIYAAATASEFLFDITEAAKYWYEENKNTGVMIAPYNASGTGYVYFKSSDSSNKPTITISYRDTKGLEGYWTYSAQSAGNAGVGYVNGFNGNLTFVHSDMSTEGAVIPITVSHIFNGFQAGLEFTSGDDVNSPKTADYSNMLVGKGWKLSVQQTVLREVIDNIPYVVYNDSDGTEHYFVQVEGVYVDEDGTGLTLTESDDGYVIENETGTEYLFGTDGKITYIVDVNGNKKRFTYNDNGSLYAIYYQPVNGSLVRQLTFTYNSQNALTQITNAYNSNDYVRFLYSETVDGPVSTENSGYLREIRYYNGSTLLNSVYYEYHTYEGIESEGKTGALKSARDGDTGYTLEYRYDTYEGRFRVAFAKENVNGTDGQKVGFSYEDKLFETRTSGTDDVYGTTDDIYSYTLFDNYGLAICSYSKLDGDVTPLGASYAEHMPYDATSETNYKVKTSAVKGITNNNLLKNPNCEASSEWNAYSNGDGYSAIYSTAQKYIGNGSLLLASVEDEYGFTQFSDSVYLKAGTYTLSAYVKLTNVSGNNGGFYLRCNNSSEHYKGTTNSAINNGWQRVSYTFTVASAGNYDVVFGLEKCVGSAYIDCAMLEKGETPSDFNFIENGGFDSDGKWSGSYTLENGGAKLVGNPTSQKRITQTVALNVPTNTTFMLSGWAKAYSMALSDDTRKFGVIAKLTYSDNTTEEFELSFNPDNNNKQYASTAIVPNAEKASVTSVQLSVAYDYNANTAYFDDISLTVEPAQTYTYDSEGNLSTTTDVEGNETVMEYHQNGVDLKDYTAITGESFEYTYNSLHQVTSVTKTVGDSTQTADYTYDRYGNTESVTLSASGSNLKITSSAAYSADGNYLVSTVNELGKTTTYNYDNVTKLLTYVQNANNVHTAYVYDNRDRTTKVYLDADKDGIPDTAEAQVAYLYANNRLSGIDTATTDYTLTYDSFGNVLTIKAGNYVLATYEYADNNGKLKKLTYGNGDYEEYIYDILDRLVSVKLNGVTEYIVKYDSNGRLYSLTESGSTHIYEYDSLDRLVRAWQENASGTKVLEVENSYDDLGRPNATTYAVNGKTMSYSINYKANSNLVNYVMMPSTGVQSNISYTYDEFERVTKKQNSFSNTYNYYEEYGYYSYTDANGVEHATSLVSSVTFGGNSSYTTPATYTYVYDNLGNIKSISKNGTQISYYSYDSLGQLISEQDCVNDKVYNYTYDKSGNITKKTVFDNITSESQTVATYTYGDSAWGDKLTAYNGTAITYDAIGNPTKWRNAVSLTWEGRELQRADLAVNVYVNYAYNSDGIRTSKSYTNALSGETRNHTYVLDGTRILSEKVIGSLSYTLYYLYDESGDVQGFIYNNAYYYYQKNLQGDVVRILNSTGNIVVEYTYDAWGKVLTISGSMASTLGQYNPFRYRSYYYDREMGFYYLQSRYYDPTVGRFLNADSSELIGANGNLQGYNLFAYCNSNPITHTDETGECIYGDEYYWFQFAGHTLYAGDICRICKKQVDWVFQAYPELWTQVQKGNPLMSGHAVSQRVLCLKAQDDAMLASLQGATRAEQQKIYEREMATALCFVAGTIVKTENGDEAIENVQVGDYVWAQDTETGEVTLKRVVRTFQNETAKLVTVKAGDEVIETTPEHPFYVPDCDETRGNSTGLGFGWIKAKDLRPGDTLVLLDGSTATVDSVTFTTLDRPIAVYNFEVEDFHTYYVGKNGLLVHNVCVAGDSKGYNAVVRYESNHPPHAHIRYKTKDLASIAANGNIVAGSLDKKAQAFVNQHRWEILSGIMTYYIQ